MKGRIASSRSRSRFGGDNDYEDLKVGNINYYKFEETTGTVSYDSVGSNNTTSSGLDLGTIGIIGNGISSTGGGTSKYLKIPNAVINQYALYISTWYYAESDSSLNITNINSGSLRINILGNTDEIQITIGTGFALPPVPADLNFNQWNHIVIDQTGGVMKIYINDVLKYNENIHFSSLSTYIFIGVALENQTDVIRASYKFKIDELGIWDRPLTRGEITQLYNSGNGIDLYP